MISFRLSNILPIAGRMALTALVLFAAWGILSGLAMFHIFIHRPVETAQVTATLPEMPRASCEPHRTFLWPQYPVHEAISTHELALNGVPITMQEWESSASAKSILTYYQEQMTARGWRDDMKGVRSLAEEVSLQLQNQGSKSSVPFLEQTRSSLDSTLELQRSEWSISISVEPTGERIRQSRVVIMGAPVRSLRELSISLAASGKPSVEKNKKPLDIVKKSGGAQYHTSITVKNGNPGEVFQKSLAELNARNWRLSMQPFRQGASNYFAWVMKDDDYGTLSVKAMPHSQTSSVSFTEVTSAR